MKPSAFALLPLLSQHLRLMLLVMVAFSISACSWHKEKGDLNPPKYKPKPPVDPVEQRVFYKGWRRPY